MISKYTVYLKTLMEDESVKPKLDNALSTYPLYVPKIAHELIPNRSELNQKLLNHYQYREIGSETVGKFLDLLETTMCEIMPYYNERFKTIEIMANLENPFDNVDFVETYKETRTGDKSNTITGNNEVNSEKTGNTTSATEDNGSTTSTTNAEDNGSTSVASERTSEGDNKSVHTTTPSSSVLGIQSKNIDTVTHADEITWNKINSSEGETALTTTSNTSESSTSGTSSNSSESSSQVSESSTTTGESTINENGATSESIERTLTRKGNHGVTTYAHDIMKYRDAIIDVVKEIINDKNIKQLFMLIY